MWPEAPKTQVLPGFLQVRAVIGLCGLASIRVVSGTRNRVVPLSPTSGCVVIPFAPSLDAPR